MRAKRSKVIRNSEPTPASKPKPRAHYYASDVQTLQDRVVRSHVRQTKKMQPSLPTLKFLTKES